MILLLTYLLEYKKKDLNISVSSKTPLKELEYSYEFSDRYLKEVDDLINVVKCLLLKLRNGTSCIFQGI